MDSTLAIENKNANMEKMINMYIESLCEKEVQALNIAKSLLGSSFKIEISIGYLQWKQSQNF